MQLTKIAQVLIIVLFSISCQKKEEAPLLALHVPETLEETVKDTNTITIPLGLELQKPSALFLQEKSEAVAKYYQKYIGQSDFSGSFIVAKNGTVIYEDYKGYADFNSKKEIDASTPIHLASISKVLTATLVLKLTQAGLVELDQKVQHYIPNFPYSQTTVRTLLNHRSGLPHYSRFGETIKGWNSKKLLTNADVLTYLSKHKFPLLSKNNSTFNYCNTNYAILALVIESVTELSYPEAMKKMVFEPLEMNDSFVIDFPNQKKEVCQSYKSNYVNYGWDQFDAIYGDKNIYATPRDLVKFDLATYSADFLSAALWEEALKGYSYEKKGQKNYGLGIRIREWETGQKVHYHNGWWHGNTTSYTTLKNDTIVIVALANKYTQKTYKAMKLASLFGDYPFELEETP
ncbi:serine hydrolase domain-containing protein [Flavobacterium sp.]|uniref:serine hydrolase domain-containing protein n=1 Tax=Flavobacterium sp. TaxID=239 RepID=UPI002FD8D191